MKKRARKRKREQRNVGSYRTGLPQRAVGVPPTVRRHLSAMRKSLILAIIGANCRCFEGGKKEIFTWPPDRAQFRFRYPRIARINRSNCIQKMARRKRLFQLAEQWERRRLGRKLLPGHPRRRDASGPKGCELARLSLRKPASGDNHPVQKMIGARQRRYLSNIGCFFPKKAYERTHPNFPR